MRALSPPLLEERLRVRERPSGWPLLRMQWQRLIFLHWSWDASEIQKTLPAGLFVDTYEGKAWLAVTPLFMRRVHPKGLPCVPSISDFLELNVRTYVHDGAGLPGVWFYSLDCNQPLAVELARRCFCLNYLHSHMEGHIDQNGTCSYKMRRHGFEEASFRYGLPVSDAIAQPGSLEFFLIERYLLFAASPKGRLYAGRIHHLPYRFGNGSLEKWSFLPAQADGFVDPGRPPDHVMVVKDIDVQAWVIRKHAPSSLRPQ